MSSLGIWLPVSRAPRAATHGDWVQNHPRLIRRHVTAPRRPAREVLYLPSMSKTRKRSRRAATDRSATTDVVTQLMCAIKNPHAAALGALVGGLVPWFGRTLAHDQVPATWSSDNHGLAMLMIAVVLGCACFSALSVYKFGRAAFGDSRKALGFVLALEGVMLVSTGATSAVALAVLILINAMANGSVIALARDATRRRCEADARRAATRARSRASRENATTPHVPAAPQPPRATHTPVLVKVPRWTPTVDVGDTVIDAEIVSEELFS